MTDYPCRNVCGRSAEKKGGLCKTCLASFEDLYGTEKEKRTIIKLDIYDKVFIAGFFLMVLLVWIALG